MDIQTIQLQLMQRANTVTLQGVDNELSPFTAIFVTLNPAGKGYGGRRKLPDNLKSLFLPLLCRDRIIILLQLSCCLLKVLQKMILENA